MSGDDVKRLTVIPPLTGGSIAPRETSLPVAVPKQTHEILAFIIADETYALPLSAVREILKVPPITGVPRAPRDVLGIISVRGRITTVRDLRRLLRMPEAEVDKHTRVLLVEDGDEVIGLLVDRVLQVFRLDEDEVELAAVVGGDVSEHVLGVGRPRAGRRASGTSSLTAADAARLDMDILVLLSPGPLLRR